ncbi:hypothetical protein ACFTSF_23475 [Kribbella sp. NPDC056951]
MSFLSTGVLASSAEALVHRRLEPAANGVHFGAALRSADFVGVLL